MGEALAGELRSVGRCDSQEQRPQGMVGGGPSLGRWQASDHRGGDRPALKDQFFLERHRAKTLEGLLSRLTAKIAAYTCGQRLNDLLGRPLRHLADLLV